MKAFVFSILLGFTTSIQSHIIVFDVGGVLLGTDNQKAFQYKYKPLNLNLYYLTALQDKSYTNHIRSKLFELLNTITVPGLEGSAAAKEGASLALPPLMRHWLAGNITNADLRNYAMKALHAHQELFADPMEQVLVVRELACIIDPEYFVTTRTLIQPVVELLQNLYKQQKHTILLCSNWDFPSFSLSQDAFFQIFHYTDGDIVSCKEHLVKPDPAIFKRIKARYPKKAPQDLYIFIDDQVENRTAATQEGFVAMHPDEALVLLPTMCVP